MTSTKRWKAEDNGIMTPNFWPKIPSQTSNPVWGQEKKKSISGGLKFHFSHKLRKLLKYVPHQNEQIAQKLAKASRRMIATYHAQTGNSQNRGKERVHSLKENKNYLKLSLNIFKKADVS